MALVCSVCGEANRDGARFCARCGQRLLARCTTCDSELPDSAWFCDSCGAPVADRLPDLAASTRKTVVSAIGSTAAMASSTRCARSRRSVSTASRRRSSPCVAMTLALLDGLFTGTHFEARALFLNEVDEMRRSIHSICFDLSQIGEALVELDERFLAGEGPS